MAKRPKDSKSFTVDGKSVTYGTTENSSNYGAKFVNIGGDTGNSYVLKHAYKDDANESSIRRIGLDEGKWRERALWVERGFINLIITMLRSLL